MHSIKIGLIGDYNPNITAHNCIPLALQISAKKLKCEVDVTWLLTEKSSQIKDVDGVWCVPGSPYQNRSNALQMIQFARTNKIPYLGTCGGYQHALLEYAKNQLGLAEAELEEENPNAKLLLISSLPCRLHDESRNIFLKEGSKLKSFLTETQIFETYRCGYGMNPAYASLFNQSNLQFVAFNEDKVPQAFELKDHPFFIGTGFQPERSAMSAKSHPLVEEFIKTCFG